MMQEPTACLECAPIKEKKFLKGTETKKKYDHKQDDKSAEIR